VCFGEVWPLPEAMTDEALETALSLFARAGTALVVRSREHHLGRPYSVRHGNIATEIAMQGSPSHGENRGSSPLGSANKISMLP
jgi:hypothetical protein